KESDTLLGVCHARVPGSPFSKRYFPEQDDSDPASFLMNPQPAEGPSSSASPLGAIDQQASYKFFRLLPKQSQLFRPNTSFALAQRGHCFPHGWSSACFDIF